MQWSRRPTDRCQSTCSNTDAQAVAVTAAGDRMPRIRAWGVQCATNWLVGASSSGGGMEPPRPRSVGSTTAPAPAKPRPGPTAAGADPGRLCHTTRGRLLQTSPGPLLLHTSSRCWQTDLHWADPRTQQRRGSSGKQSHMVTAPLGLISRLHTSLFLQGPNNSLLHAEAKALLCFHNVNCTDGKSMINHLIPLHN